MTPLPVAVDVEKKGKKRDWTKVQKAKKKKRKKKGKKSREKKKKRREKKKKLHFAISISRVKGWLRCSPLPLSLSPLTPKHTESKSTRETQPTRFMLSGGWAWQKLVSLPFARVSLSAPGEPANIYSHAARCFERATRIHACCIFLYLSLFFFLFFSSPLSPSARWRAWMQEGWKKERKVERVGGKFRDEQPRFRPFTETRLLPPFLSTGTRWINQREVL